MLLFFEFCTWYVCWLRERKNWFLLYEHAIVLAYSYFILYVSPGWGLSNTGVKTKRSVVLWTQKCAGSRFIFDLAVEVVGCVYFSLGNSCSLILKEKSLIFRRLKKEIITQFIQSEKPKIHNLIVKFMNKKKKLVTVNM